MAETHRRLSVQVPADRAADDVLQAYRDAIADSDAILGGIGDLDHLHAGHADLLRELIDGTTAR